MNIIQKTGLLLLTVALSTNAFAQERIGTLTNTKKSPETIAREIEEGKAYLVDVRTPEEYKEGHLNHSTNVDFKADDFKTRISRLDKRKPIYLYCRSGNRSGKAADTLQVLGFSQAYNIGGFADLKAAGLPSSQ
ncbi:rhodanese-like domain-containing protein [Spirosoma sp. KNUC1025]|uniref:rhodanese-like domain-containing protein n=1 Tax=Spirosoma sp. KNUC1025 TaxID=2894082 RepID=UPI00386E5A33|nr:rhodanese-like domain-containing protein [Spirosoma sp. KNUC1025]